MLNCVDIVNGEDPDLVVIAGVLSLEGYREQFQEARGYIDLISCPRKTIIAGNHDCRNVGYLHFEEITVDMVSSSDGSRHSCSYPRWWCYERFAGYPG